MPYYSPPQGDYRTYGYGRGDPGFLSSLWKGVKKIAAPIIGGMIGGPFGAVIGGAIGGGGGQPPPIRQIPQPRSSVGLNLGPISARSTDFYPPVPKFSGAPMAAGARGGRAGPVGMDASGCCPVGYHMAKSGPPRCVRNRRMNVANPRALRRSMRRVQGFEKLARRTISFTKRVRMKK